VSYFVFHLKVINNNFLKWLLCLLLEDNLLTNHLAVSQVVAWITRGLVNLLTANF